MLHVDADPAFSSLSVQHCTPCACPFVQLLVPSCHVVLHTQHSFTFTTGRRPWYLQQQNIRGSIPGKHTSTVLHKNPLPWNIMVFKDFMFQRPPPLSVGPPISVGSPFWLSLLFLVFWCKKQNWLTIFWHYVCKIWPIFEQYLTNIWPIFDKYLTNI